MGTPAVWVTACASSISCTLRPSRKGPVEMEAEVGGGDGDKGGRRSSKIRDSLGRGPPRAGAQLRAQRAQQGRTGQHELGAHQRRAKGDAPGVCMEHRDDCQHGGAAPQIESVGERDRKRVQKVGAVAVEHPLRQPRGPARVAEPRSHPCRPMKSQAPPAPRRRAASRSTERRAGNSPPACRPRRRGRRRRAGPGGGAPGAPAAAQSMHPPGRRCPRRGP